MLRFHLLGPFEAWRNDEPILPADLRTRQTLSLLKLLLDERDRTISFERIVDLIWPDSDPANARQSLRVAIRTMRLALEPELARGADSRYIRTEPGGYRFVATGCTLDVDLFLSARQRAETAERDGNGSAAISAYEEAISLYRGEYLADDPYDDWLVSSRERFQNDYLENLERLSELRAGNGEWDRAITLVNCALKVDPFREDLYRQLMRYQAALGRRSHAIAAYEQCRRLFRLELGIELSTATVTLRDEIAAGDLFATTATASQAWISRIAEFQTPFAGRRAEIQALTSVWRRTGSEGSRVVYLTGLPGSGKTRLAQRFAEQIELAETDRSEARARVFWMYAYETETRLLFAPLTRMLANWLEGWTSRNDRQRMSRYAPVISHLLPQVSEIWPELRLATGRLQPAQETGQLFEALTRAMMIVFGKGPALFILDDIHWADDSTLHWLSYALHRLPASVLTIAISRSSEPVPDALNQLIDVARRADRLTRLTLTPLTPAETEELLAVRLRHPEERHQFGRRLYDATGGQPLFVVETLRELFSQGLLYTDDDGGWRVIPPSGDEWESAFPNSTVRETILGRVARLNREARDVLTAVCVVGGECGAPLVAEVTATRMDNALTALDTLLERRLLRNTDDGRGYIVEHSLIQRVVYDDLSPGRRQDWHRRVARALQRHHASRPAPGAAQVLWHLMLGDASADELAQAGELAGDHALSHYAYAEAADLYATVLEQLTVQLPDLAVSAQIASVQERRADALAGGGRWDEAIAAYRSLIAGSDLPLDRSRLRRKLARVLGDVLGRFDAALSELDTAEARLPENGNPEIRIELGRIESARTAAFILRGDYDLVIEHGERALALWDSLPGVESDRLEQVLRIGQAQQRLGSLSQAEERYRWVDARARIIGDRLIEARSRDSLGAVFFHRGRLTEALEAHDTVIRLASDLGAPRQELVGLVNYANTLTQLGELSRARASYEVALERAVALDARYTVMHVSVGLGEVLTRLGEFPDARSYLASGVARASEIGNPQRGWHAYLYLAELNLLEDDPETAKVNAEYGISNGIRINDAHALREGYPLLARALLAVDEVEAAEEAARNGLEVARAGGFVLSEGRNLCVLGQTLARRNQLDLSAEVIDEAERLFRDSESRYDLSFTLFIKAATLASRQSPDVAFDEALDLARNAGAKPLARMIADTRAHLQAT